MTDRIVLSRVTILHNVTSDHSGRPLGMLDGYRPGHILVPVCQYVENTTLWDFATVAERLCNEAYRLFNAEPRTTAEEVIEAVYRARKNRSLSVGDVVAVTEFSPDSGAYSTRYYAVAKAGWDQLDTPPRWVAFASTHGSTNLDRDEIVKF